MKIYQTRPTLNVGITLITSQEVPALATWTDLDSREDTTPYSVDINNKQQLKNIQWNVCKTNQEMFGALANKIQPSIYNANQLPNLSKNTPALNNDSVTLDNMDSIKIDNADNKLFVDILLGQKTNWLQTAIPITQISQGYWYPKALMSPMSKITLTLTN